MSDNARDEKLMRSALQAGFNAGWRAAMTRVADLYAKQGAMQQADYLRDWSTRPDAIEMVRIPMTATGGDA